MCGRLLFLFCLILLLLTWGFPTFVQHKHFPVDQQHRVTAANNSLLLVGNEQRAHLFNFQWDRVITCSLSPLQLSTVSSNLFPSSFLWLLNPLLSHPHTFTFHPSCPLASIISSFYLLHIPFPPFFLCNTPPSPPCLPLAAPPVIKAPSPLMVGKAHRLSWSASGFTVSSSANVIRAICAHTHTHTQTDKHTYKHTKQISPSLRQTATSDGLFSSMDYVWRFTSLQPPLFPSVPHVSLNDSLWATEPLAVLWLCVYVCPNLYVPINVCAHLYVCEGRGVKGC